jgi:hypothetical protein
MTGESQAGRSTSEKLTDSSRPLSGRSVEWTLIPPPTMQIKKKLLIAVSQLNTVSYAPFL